MTDTPKTADVLGREAGGHTQPEPESGSYARIPDFSPGSVVADKYLVEREIEEGGIGVVVKAKHVQLDQAVAIKYLKPLALTMPGVVERFVREARLAAKITSQHAVKVHDVDTLEGGVPYMVMEFLEGRSLGQMLEERGRIPLQETFDYLLQACEALAEAHAAGIVHRDLKPDNLFVAHRPAGEPLLKVLDFGISKVMGRARRGRTSEPPGAITPSDPREKRLTRANDMFGTPAFMSPEQLQSSADVDARADIWALGVVLYELLTGRLPFDADDIPELSKAILSRPPMAMRHAWPEAPAEVEAIVLRCLEKDRERRYRNVAELAQDLAQVFTREAPSRVQQIARVIRGAGQSIRPPTPFPGSIHIQPLPASAAKSEEVVAPSPEAPPDAVIAVFSDASGTVLVERSFQSIDEAYQVACALPGPAVRCDVHEQFAEVRGKCVASYVRKPDTPYWVPVFD